MNRKVLGYGRVSLLKQVISPEVQTNRCKAWFDSESAKPKWEGNLTWAGMILDPAASGKVELFHRPKGQHILTELSRGDILVVAKDSLAFPATGDVETTVDALNELGVRLIILNLGVDTATPTGMQMVAMFAAIAQCERELVSERTSEALHHRMAEGQWIGQPPPGWKLRTKKQMGQRNNQLVPIPAIRTIGEWVAHQIAKGVAIEKVCLQINRWVPKDLIPRVRGSRDKWYSPRCVLAWAVYHVCDWPPVRRSKLKETLGVDPFNLEFVRDRYIDQGNGIDRLDLSKLSS